MRNDYQPPTITAIGSLHGLTAQTVPPGKVFGFADGFSLTDDAGTTITAGSPTASTS